MTAMDLMMGLNGVQDRFIADAEEFRQGIRKNRRLPKRKLWLIAAVVALALLLVGCAVLYALRLQDMEVGQIHDVQEEWYGPAGEYVPATEKTISLMSLQGYSGSPEQSAMREWIDFQDQYDTDHTLLNENNHNESGIPEAYLSYGCYTFEMVDKLNEILEKYDLKHLSAQIHTHEWEQPLLYRALQIDRLCSSDSEITDLVGYFFPEGSFGVEFLHTLEGTQRIVSYYYAQNGYLFPFYTAIDNAEQWTQWDYITADGTDVLLASYENALVILCARGKDFITVRTENNTWQLPDGASQEGMTRETAERIADSLCFSIDPKPCDPAQVEQMRADYPQPVKQQHFAVGFRRNVDDAKSGRWFPPAEHAGSFEDYISYMLASKDAVGNENVGQLQYCITDLNGDGNPEVLLQYRDTGKYREILEMAPSPEPDTQHQEVSVRFISGYVYEGPVFELITDSVKLDGFLFYEYKDFSWNSLNCIRYDTTSQTWTKSSTGADTHDAIWQPISEADANAIRNAYTPLSLDMKPLSLFSIN